MTSSISVMRVTVFDSAGRHSSGEVTANPIVTGETLGTIESVVTGPIAEALMGAGLDDVRGAIAALRSSCHGHESVKAAVSAALYALRFGETWSNALLLGSSQRVKTAVTVSIDEPAKMARIAQIRYAEGFRALKVKLGDGVDDDIERLRALTNVEWSADTPSLWIDANQAWTATETLRVLDAWDRMSSGAPLLWVEQPTECTSFRAMKFVADRTRHPLLADESVQSSSDIASASDAGASGVNIKLAKCGGLDEARNQSAVAQAEGVTAVVGCMMESPFALEPAVALASTLDAGATHDLDAAWWLSARANLSYVDGYVSVAPMVTRG